MTRRGTGPVRWSRRPITWAITYLALIPIFAFIFRVQIGSFYYSTAQHEPAVASSALRVSDLIEEALVGQIRRNGSAFLRGQELDLGEGWTLDVEEDIDVSAVAATSDTLTFRLNVDTRLTSMPGIFQHSFLVSMDFSPTAIAVRFAASSKFKTVFAKFEVPEAYETPVAFSIHDLFLTGKEETLVRPTVHMEVTPELERSSKAYFRAVNGHPDSVGGGLARMLYLSVVTIATLGTGDIVPTTGLTRLLVSTEAVLGIVVMGLFLNSLVVAGRQTEKARGR